MCRNTFTRWCLHEKAPLDWGEIGRRGKSNAVVLNPRLPLCWCFIIEFHKQPADTDKAQEEFGLNDKARVSETNRLWDVLDHRQVRLWTWMLRWYILPAGPLEAGSWCRGYSHIEQAVGKNVPEHSTEHKQGVNAEKYPKQRLLLKPLLVVLQDHHA